MHEARMKVARRRMRTGRKRMDAVVMVSSTEYRSTSRVVSSEGGNAGSAQRKVAVEREAGKEEWTLEHPMPPATGCGDTKRGYWLVHSSTLALEHSRVSVSWSPTSQGPVDSPSQSLRPQGNPSHPTAVAEMLVRVVTPITFASTSATTSTTTSSGQWPLREHATRAPLTLFIWNFSVIRLGQRLAQRCPFHPFGLGPGTNALCHPCINPFSHPLVPISPSRELVTSADAEGWGRHAST